MAKGVQTDHELLPHLFRQEYSKMTAVLCRHFGIEYIETAEDIASETFLKASEYWAINGIPENPIAWLYTVAKNKTVDYFKRQSTFDKKVKPDMETQTHYSDDELDFSEQTVSDSQLAMIFAVSNPLNSQEGQICLALQILCGFSIEEIANAFLTSRETIKKRLQRAKANLRNSKFQIKTLNDLSLKSRLDVVLKTLYLLFNEGYYSKSNSQVIRKDLCQEAIRLALVLTKYPITNTTTLNALLSLMCFQSSRLEARTDQLGESILYHKQDKNLWDKELIEKGSYFLVNACSGQEISQYHLEAGIAYWHTVPADKDKWPKILQFYDQLIQIAYSPTAALNRIFAIAQVHGKEVALIEAEKLALNKDSYYHSLLGYLNTNHPIKGIFHYQMAIDLTSSITEKKILSQELEALKRMIKKNS